MGKRRHQRKENEGPRGPWQVHHEKERRGPAWQRGNKDGLDDQCATEQQRPPDATIEIPQYGNDRPPSGPWHVGEACRHRLVQKREERRPERRERGRGRQGRGRPGGVGRGRSEANDVVREEKRESVVESGGSQSARVPFGVAVTEDQERDDRCERQAGKGRNTGKDIVVRGGPRGENWETASVLTRSNLKRPLRRCRGVGVTNMGGKRCGSGGRGKPLRRRRGVGVISRRGRVRDEPKQR